MSLAFPFSFKFFSSLGDIFGIEEMTDHLDPPLRIVYTEACWFLENFLEYDVIITTTFQKNLTYFKNSHYKLYFYS